MKVLSLFDGMSCGQIALDQLGIPVEKYYASEIDKYAIKVTQNNFPNTIQVGDVCNLKAEDYKDVDLIEPCVLAGCPEKICVECNEPYQSKIEIKRTPRWELPKDDPRYRPKKYENAHDELNGSTRHSITETKVLGLEKQCDCITNETKAGTVLDPFAGSGTTGIVAAIKNRNAVLCELNEEYIDLAVKRINESVGLFVYIITCI